ncbi:SpoIIE family protein phosphatase [Streptomyces sp. ME19-01-6]|uniref:SpoIIE family protein phosphatase n=1 Tax=Streptomyces sp. ME19-01-6 TaxID=3028686 RepID=UPI0029BA624D|nr:SpoIIE family protein phosphatase [Streptomyces sp. ME19-01-6]MDX3225870.1 SpoIIE family protein phosphatase [Streptomyces sp. ME19-01-6]
MTEHPTSHNERQATSPAAASGAPEDAHGAVPDPRTAVRGAAAPGQEPDGGRPRPAFPATGPASGQGPAADPGPGAAEPGVARPRGRATPEERPATGRRRGQGAAQRGGGTAGRRAGAGPGRRDPAAGDSASDAVSEHPAQPEHGTPEGEPVWDADHNAARGAARRPGARDGDSGLGDEPPAAGSDGTGGRRGRDARGAARRGAAAGEHPPAGAGDARAAAEVGYRPPEGGAPTAPPVPSGSGPAAEAAAARDRSGDRLRFVGAATRRIARGIDLDEIVLGLCRATVPTFADAILVYLRDPLPVGDERPVGPVVLRLRRTDRIPLDPDTESGRLPLLPSQPDLSPAVGGGPAAELCEVEAGGPLNEVLRGVRPVFGDSSAARAALPELLGGNTSVATGQRTVLAPLRGRRRVIGAAVFVRRPDRPPFEPDDLLVAAQLATHTALGVDKAVLYGREVYIADELQRTMLPDSLPQPTGVRLASRYLPAAETARVGGDWYDAIPLPGNRVALVVGDVMGHSMTSAAIMGQLRTTAQTLAGLDLPPQEVLHHLDEQAQRLGTDRMATCLYAVYDPVAHRIVVANAGHPPPLLLHRGGRAEVLRVPPGAPIGVGGVDFEAVELDAPAGATLMLYTDGLVESRMRDVWTGIEQLRERLTATAQLTGPNPPPLEPLCDEVLDMLGPGDRDDDVALLAARFEGIAPSDVAYWFLDPKAQTAGQARRLARRALARWDLDELTDAVELLVSEVITNAVRYAERPVTLRLLRTDVLRCEVGDDVPQLPRLRQARPSDEGGRGLYLVNRMARRWGATRLSTGKVVWFELAMPPRS